MVRNTPLVSIDLILRDPDDAVRVGLRTFNPAKGTWFVPGGRIGKDETLDEAFTRILQAETGLRQRPEIITDKQHSSIRWQTVAELLTDPAVHENTKAYFR